MHPHTLANLFAKSIARYTLVTKRTCSPRVVGYRQSMLQHATDLEGFAPQTSDQGSPLDGLSLRRFETRFQNFRPSPVGRNKQWFVQCQEGSGLSKVVESKFAPYPPFGPVPQIWIDNRHVSPSPLAIASQNKKSSLRYSSIADLCNFPLLQKPIKTIRYFFYQ